MPTLLPEIFELIFGYLSQDELGKCMLCCRNWHPFAQDLLYRHVILSSEQVERLRESSKSTNEKVWSLTLSLDTLPYGEDEEDAVVRKSGDKATQKLWKALNNLGERLRGMDRLQSLSIKKLEKPPPYESDWLQGCWIVHSCLEKLVRNLPDTCMALETDIPDGRVEDCHLCDTIRRAISRLEYLRLRLFKMCPDMFTLDTQTHLKQLVINTATRPFHGPGTILCSEPGIDQFDHTPMSTATSSWRSLTTQLQALVQAGHAPALEQLWIISKQGNGHKNYADWNSYMRRDVLANKSISIPFRDIASHRSPFGYLIRLPDKEGQDRMVCLWQHASWTEAHSWEETSSGTRLPSALLRRFDMLPQRGSITPQELKAQTNMSCELWLSEGKTKARLLHVEERGLMEECSHFERIPVGWRRGEGLGQWVHEESQV